MRQKPLFAIKLILLCLFISTCKTIPPTEYPGLGLATDMVPFTSRALTGNLPNGLRYIILENTLPENRAHLALVVNAGSVLEKENERGLAHFVEHLAFNDTARFPKLELIEYLRSLGMRFGADANAYTSYNETVYHFDVPVENVNGTKHIPDKALAILDDWTYAVSFLPRDVESESKVVLEEMRTRLGAMDRVREITLPILFAGSAYENRKVIGLSEVIENATPELVRGFYNRWYTSDNMTLVFVGDIDGKALEAELAKHFNMPKATKPVNRPVYELPPPKNGNFHVQIITDPELTSSDFLIYYKQKQGAKRGSIEYYRETIIDYLIDTMLSLRFAEIAENPQAAATDYWGGVWRWAANSRFYTIGVSPKTGSAPEALNELMLEKEAMRRYGFTEVELERAKLSLLSYMEKQVSEKDRRESRTFIRGFTSHVLYNEDFADIEWEMDAVVSLLPGIGLNEIAQNAKDYFSYNDCVVFLLAPEAEKEKLPSVEQIKQIITSAEKAQIEQRQTETVTAQLLETQPAPGLITRETADSRTDAVTLTLSNGAKVILKQTANRNNEIIMYAMAKGGVLNAPAEHDISASLAAEMMSASGVGQYSRTQLVNMLAGKQVSASFWAGNYYRGFQGSSTTGDLKTFFELFYLYFTQPRFDENAITAMLEQYRTNLMHQNENPQRYFSNELTKLLYSNHPRFMPMVPEDLQKVSIEQAKSFIAQCLNPADYTIVFTGNIDMEVMREYSKIYIASIENKSSSSINRWVNPNITRPRGVNKTIYKGKDERCIVYLAWFVRGPNDFNEKRNQVSAVLSEYLDIVLTDEIREKLGGVYSISAGTSVSVIPTGELSIGIYFVCDPGRADELISAVIASLNKIVSEGVKADTFNKAKEALLMQHESQMQRNLHIAQSYANSTVLYNTPLARLNNRPDVIRTVTAQEVQALCREALAARPVQLVLYPEK